MDTSGRPTEGWMTVVPVTIFVLIVIFALGGPGAFLTFVSNWLWEVWTYLARWLRHL